MTYDAEIHVTVSCDVTWFNLARSMEVPPVL